MRVTLLSLILAELLFLPLSQAPGAETLSFDTTTQPTEWTIQYHGQPLMVYSFAPQKFKPYVKALHTIQGVNVLRDSPFDHLHHHALMYGIRVNGLNFWEETSGAGIQRTAQITPPVFGRSAVGLPQATLTQLLYWVAPEDAFLSLTNTPALLIEHRTLNLTVNEALQEVALHWNSQFEVGSKTNTVVLTGANYHGLGMRFLKELDSPAVHFTSEGHPDLSGTKQDISPHAWEAVTFENAAKPATIALFGHPDNAHGEAHFFAMHAPFAYLSATQNLDQEPLVYHRGDKFELNYLITLYPGNKSAEALAQRAEQWRSSRQ